jgi:hypothetical protein
VIEHFTDHELETLQADFNWMRIIYSTPGTWKEWNLSVTVLRLIREVKMWRESAGKETE